MTLTILYKGPIDPPQQSYPGDAGFDLVVCKPALVHPDQYVDCQVDLEVALPHGVWGLVIGRSSTLRNRGLLVDTAVIDNGYRGKMFVGVRNVGHGTQEVMQGDRLAQLVPMPLLAEQIIWQRQATLPISERAERGFGSSGR